MNFTRTYFLILAVSVALAILSGSIKNFPYLVVIFSLPMFLLPESFEGSRGSMGPYGDPGVMGPKGPLGYTGDAGYVGYKGPEGSTGPVGPMAPWPQYRGAPGPIHTNTPHVASNLVTVVIPGDFVGVFIGVEFRGQYYSLFKLKSSLVAKEVIRFRRYYGPKLLDEKLILVDIQYYLTFADENDRNSQATLTFHKSSYFDVDFRQWYLYNPTTKDYDVLVNKEWHNIPNPVRYVKVIRKI